MTTIDDTTAIHLLKTIAKTRLKSAESESALTPELGHSLAATFGDPPQTNVSEGDLARAALQLLSEDPSFAEPIRLMTSRGNVSDRPDRYFDPSSSTIALTTAVLFVLQTRIKIKAKWGNCSIDVDKKAAGDATLKLVVQRLLSFLDRWASFQKGDV
jgi:hypothetical protein